ncbi:MAG TPA: hypothetical protein VGX48_18675 [Pyrinomonadaceae bacterium]|jgi:hypothetical protein|nr:hypothetical protein [Pyrinomonadaceae bacterium]
MHAPNACDDCGRKSPTLYERDRLLICIYCLPDEAVIGLGALRSIKAAVTGVVNIERRRRSLAGGPSRK